MGEAMTSGLGVFRDTRSIEIAKQKAISHKGFEKKKGDNMGCGKGHKKAKTKKPKPYKKK